MPAESQERVKFSTFRSSQLLALPLPHSDQDVLIYKFVASNPNSAILTYLTNKKTGDISAILLKAQEPLLIAPPIMLTGVPLYYGTVSDLEAMALDFDASLREASIRFSHESGSSHYYAFHDRFNRQLGIRLGNIADALGKKYNSIKSR